MQGPSYFFIPISDGPSKKPGITKTRGCMLTYDFFDMLHSEHACSKKHLCQQGGKPFTHVKIWKIVFCNIRSFDHITTYLTCQFQRQIEANFGKVDLKAKNTGSLDKGFTSDSCKLFINLTFLGHVTELLEFSDAA